MKPPKLTDAQVSAARVDYARGARTSDLAARYGMTRCRMLDAIAGRSYKHVPGAVQPRPVDLELAGARTRFQRAA